MAVLVSRSLAAHDGARFSRRAARVRRADAQQRISDRAGTDDRARRRRLRRARSRTLGPGAPAVRGRPRSEYNSKVLRALVLAHTRAHWIGSRMARRWTSRKRAS